MVFLLSGYYFYWVGWIIWTILVFFRVYRNKRYIIICWLFLLMISLNYYVTIEHYDISISFLLLLIGSIYIYVQPNLTLQRFFITFTLMTAYIALRIWEVVAPIWFFIPTVIMIPLIISIGTVVLVQPFKQRMIHIIFSITFGELFHSLILNGYYLHNEIVPLLFFDYLAITMLILICLQIVRSTMSYIVQISTMLLNKTFFIKNK